MHRVHLSLVSIRISCFTSISFFIAAYDIPLNISLQLLTGTESVHYRIVSWNGRWQWVFISQHISFGWEWDAVTLKLKMRKGETETAKMCAPAHVCVFAFVCSTWNNSLATAFPLFTDINHVTFASTGKKMLKSDIKSQIEQSGEQHLTGYRKTRSIVV